MFKLFNNTSLYISGLELSKASFKRKHTIKDTHLSLRCICLVGPGLFIMGSFYSTKLALFDTSEMTHVSHLDLQQGEGPVDVCLIPGDKVAVTCEWSNRIVIVSVKNNQLHREHEIRIECQPFCITSYKDDLFVVASNVIPYEASISRVTLTGDRHVVCDLPIWFMWDVTWRYSMTTSKESEPKIYVTHCYKRDVLEVSLDGSTLRSISISHTEGDIRIMTVVSVGENTLCLFSAENKLILADIKSEKTSVIMKQKKEHRWHMHRPSVCPVTKTLLIWDYVKHKIKMFKWK